MPRERIWILDFGSQYTMLIARRIRECGVYSEIVPWDTKFEDVPKDVKGIVFSGGPASVYEQDAPLPDRRFLEGRIPVLGICYGMQAIAFLEGGRVERGRVAEYGPAEFSVSTCDSLFSNFPDSARVWMSHWDEVKELPKGYICLGSTPTVKNAAMRAEAKPVYGVQFHPEVIHSTRGVEIFEGFLMEVCGCAGGWGVGRFIEEIVPAIRETVGDSGVVLGLSGGVDSSVTSALLYRAIGDRVYPILVDTGLLRKGEVEYVKQSLERAVGLEIIVVDARDEFFSALRGVVDPEEKRRIIGHKFVEIFEREAGKLPRVRFLAQGTLYPDRIESKSVLGPSATIKTHHNVGGLPEKMSLELIEPLADLFKDEVRALGEELGLPKELVSRHPFPGPGLAVRIIGEITPERVEILREADAIFIEEIKRAGLYDEIWQAFAVFLPVKSVGVMGDFRTYDNVIALRAVVSTDGMTADWYEFPHSVLRDIAVKIINEVEGVNRVVYDVSPKPPATIEWE